MSEEAMMTEKDSKKRLVGPWRSVHAAIWLIGLAVLAIFNWWWPGILVLVAISGLYEAYLRQNVAQAYEAEPPKVPESQTVDVLEPTPPVASTAMTGVSLPVQEHQLELLPQVCPSCSGPIRGHEVKWTGRQSANCPYCGTNLPMSKV